MKDIPKYSLSHTNIIFLCLYIFFSFFNSFSIWSFSLTLYLSILVLTMILLRQSYIPIALQSGEVDILSRNTTWTMTRDATLGLKSTATTYYDGQGFMVNKSLGVKSAKELDGATICTEGGTTTEMNMADYFHANKMKYTPVVFDNSDQTVKGFESGRCDVLTSDKSQLFAVRVKHDIVDVFCSDGKPDRVRMDSRREQFLFGQL